MLKETMLYSLRDISVIPAVSTSIKSRKECNPFRKSIEGKDGWYPLIASPMDSVMDETNWKAYWDNKISCILPRTISFSERLRLCKDVFCAFSLNEARWFLDNPYPCEEIGFSEGLKIHVLIDIANGSMQEEIGLGRALKKKYGDGIVLMGGNIGNPQTYLLYDAAGFDFLRCGVGSGAGCFSAGTKILMSDDTYKNIEDIGVGDMVKTVVGDKEVLSTKTDVSDEIIVINDSLSCTPNHKIFVINIEDKDRITEDNIFTIGYYIDADELDASKHLLVKLEGIVIKLEKIESIKRENIATRVYDFEVSGEEHSYIANNYIVHNCLTSTSTAIHFPYASLISEISEMKYRYHSHCKIIADGGMGWYSDIIKSLALGADYVMCGRLFAQAAKTAEELGSELIYHGMSTKEAQKAMGNTNLKTAEGKSLGIKKEYTLSGWTENFDSYLRSAMSYCDSRSLQEFREKAVCQVISPNASSQINDK